MRIVWYRRLEANQDPCLGPGRWHAVGETRREGPHFADEPRQVAKDSVGFD